MIEVSEKLKNKLNEAPSASGIYKMIDSKGNIIYVGKSKQLNKRVKTYFANNPKWDKVNRMVHLIDDIEYIVTDTHLEARLLECNLIKTIKPIFNSQMKHDKGYVYLRIEDYNKNRALSVINSREENSFGPYRRKFHLNEIVNSLKNLYPIIRINDSYSFKYNLIPVSMDVNTFNENKSSLEEILTEESKGAIFIKELESKMKYEASLCNFEMASLYKKIMDNINYIITSINKYNELTKRKVLLTLPINDGYKLFYIINGKIVKKDKYSKLSKSIINKFCNTANSESEIYYDMNEKSLIDFRDIIYSETLSLPENMVTII